MKDQEYIRGFRANNERVINLFYRENRTAFFAYFRNKYGKDDEYLTDLYQDSCVALWQNINTGKLSEGNLTSSLQTYLFSVGKYSLMARDRKYKEITSDMEILNRLNIEEDDPDELMYKIEREEFIDRVIADLKSPCKEILTAFYWEKQSCDQIAERFGYSNADSVKTQKYKCISKIKALISKFTK